MEKIVIVEDDIFLRVELENILEKEGYSVECISSFDTVLEDITSASLTNCIRFEFAQAFRIRYLSEA